MAHTWTVPAGPAMTLSANFDMEYQLTMTAGSGGSVSQVTGWIAGDTQVQLLATPNAGYAFERWTGSGNGAYSGTMNPVTITVQNPVSESAVFRQATGVQTDTRLPATVTLDQNIPNPARGGTLVSFTLPKSQIVTLVVTDILGQERLRPLDQSPHDAGTHQVAVSVAGLPAGVYLYRLETADGVLVRRMVLMK